MQDEVKFRKIDSIESVVEYLSSALAQHLEDDEKVLWLVPGGSAIKIAAVVSKLLPKDKLKKLTVTLTDERYGPVGHKDSNWPQLKSAGFKLDGANLQPVLAGLNLEETADRYSKLIEEELKKTDYSIALVGMGPDGHILGIKPRSPAVDSDRLAVGYKWDDFIRLTLTERAIKQLDEIVIYAVGEEKWPQFDVLKTDISTSQQPAQILKRLKKVIIFSDYKGNGQ